MQYDDPDYDDLDALLEDNTPSDNESSAPKQAAPIPKNVNFNDAIDNTMSRLTNLKLNDGKTKARGNGLLGNDDDDDGFGMLEDLVRLMQGKDILYKNLLKFRDELKQWVDENPDSTIIKDRRLQLDNCNKRIAIYERADYTDEKYGGELKDLTTEFLEIPNQFGGSVGDITSDDMTTKITQEFLTKDMMYASTVSYRDELREWLADNKTEGKLRDSREKELEIYNKVIAIFESKDYSPKDEKISQEIFDLLEQTKDLYESQPLGSNKAGDDNNSDLQNELLKALDDIAGTAMDCFNTDDKDMDPATKAEQEKLLKELEQGCPQQ